MLADAHISSLGYLWFVWGKNTILEFLTGNPGSVIVPQYSSSKITVFVWGKNIILKFLGNTK